MDKSIYHEDWSRLCDRLRSLRTDAGLNQTELADRLGVTQAYVSKYERGDRRLDLLQLREVCEALGVPLSEVAAEFDRPSG